MFHPCYILGAVAFISGGSGIHRSENEGKQPQHISLHSKLISDGLLAAQHVGVVEAAGYADVVCMAGGNVRREGQPVLFQREQIVLAAQIHGAAAKERKIEDNIFIFHMSARDMLKPVDMSGRCKDNITLLHLEHRKIYLREPLSLFDVDDLHRILPMGEDRGKIIRDSAEIDIVGEQKSSMLFCFVIRLHGRTVYI